MPSIRAPTFDDIALENRKRLELMNVIPNNKAVSHTLMQMMSCMGELSNLAYHNETSLSPFEQTEVRGIIGKLVVCLATIGEVFDIDVGQAAMDTVTNQLHKASRGALGPSAEEPKRLSPPIQATATVKDVGGHCASGQQLDILLSPTSNRDFFGFLDELVTYDRSGFEKAELKWVAPLPDGTMQELIENGSNINVQYEDLPKYLDCVKHYRDARCTTNKNKSRNTNNNNSSNSEAHGNKVNADANTIHYASSQQQHQQIKNASLPIAVGNYSNERELPISSPNPLDGGLMSPQHSGFPLAADTSANRANVVLSSNTSGGDVGSSEADFNSKVEWLKRGIVTGAKIAQLNLTFSMPRNGRLVELIPNGIHVKVTSANVTEFLRLLGDKSAIQNGRVRRLESIKKLEVCGAGPQDLLREKDKFSPTHFSKDIFAPYEDRTSFLVDCDASDEILPVFIKEREQLQRGAESQYVRVVRQGDLRIWKFIIDEVLNDSSALKRYGVTFCVPAAVVLDATEEEQLTKVHELMEGGISTPVEDSQLWLFSRLIEPFYNGSS